MSPKDWAYLLPTPMELTLNRSESLMTAGQQYNMFGKILDGSCRLGYGSSQLLIGQGEVLGEIPFLTGLAPSVSVVACENGTKVLVIDGTYINCDVAASAPLVAAKFFRYLASTLTIRMTKTLQANK